MTEQLLNLEVTEHAKIARATLGPEDRRLVDAWFDHLRNWHNDEFIRSRSRLLKPKESVYTFETSSDIIIAFEIRENLVTVLSIFRKDSLRPFETMSERTSA